MRAVVDVNVLISGVLSARGTCAEILRRGRDGDFELIVSELLIAELARALAYPKLRKRMSAEQGEAYVSWVRGNAVLAADPASPPALHSPDPDDDYLLALAVSCRAFLVTGDEHLLGLGTNLPIVSAAQFLAALRDSS